jgi:hypothetical protein
MSAEAQVHAEVRAFWTACDQAPHRPREVPGDRPAQRSRGDRNREDLPGDLYLEDDVIPELTSNGGNIPHDGPAEARFCYDGLRAEAAKRHVEVAGEADLEPLLRIAVLRTRLREDGIPRAAGFDDSGADVRWVRPMPPAP